MVNCTFHGILSFHQSDRIYWHKVTQNIILLKSEVMPTFSFQILLIFVNLYLFSFVNLATDFQREVFLSFQIVFLILLIPKFLVFLFFAIYSFSSFWRQNFMDCRSNFFWTYFLLSKGELHLTNFVIFFIIS